MEKYREAGISWWDYVGPILVNSYPTYFEKLPPLVAKINREKRSSKNYSWDKPMPRATRLRASHSFNFRSTEGNWS